MTIIIITTITHLYSALGPKIQRRLMQHRRTKWVWTDGFSSGVRKWECFHTVKCQQVESSWWMEQQQKKRDGPVRCVCEERRASEEHRARGGENWDMFEWLWSAPCESEEPLRWPAASTEASVARAKQRPGVGVTPAGSGRRLWPGRSGRAVVCQKSYCSNLYIWHDLPVTLTTWRRRRRRMKTGAGDSLFARLNNTTTIPAVISLRLPVPWISERKLYIISWLSQNLSNLVLKQFTVLADTTPHN